MSSVQVRDRCENVNSWTRGSIESQTCASSGETVIFATATATRVDCSFRLLTLGSTKGRVIRDCFAKCTLFNYEWNSLKKQGTSILTSVLADTQSPQEVALTSQSPTTPYELHIINAITKVMNVRADIFKFMFNGVQLFVVQCNDVTCLLSMIICEPMALRILKLVTPSSPLEFPVRP